MGHLRPQGYSCDFTAISNILIPLGESLPTLIAVLDSVAAPSGQSSLDVDLKLVRALEAIEEMGPTAKAAIPSIERVRTFSMAARHAANRALRAISDPVQRDAQNGT